MSGVRESSRWWEFYAVRYGMGTVIGGVVFYFLCLTNPVLKNLLFLAPDGRLDGTQLTLLAAYGLMYCYISSGPILVFHASRFLLSMNENGKDITAMLEKIFLVPIIISIMFLIENSNNSTLMMVVNTSMAFFASTIIWTQWVCIYSCLKRHEMFFSFYKNLSTKRQTNRDITDSYKHLREHGNSFFIVLLEIVLGLILYKAGSYEPNITVTTENTHEYITPYLVIVILWIMPSAMIWFVGTVFERKFIENA